MNKKVAVWITLFILLTTAIVGRPDVSTFDPTVNDWDVVEPWEIEFCKHREGYTGQFLPPGSTATLPTALSQLTMTLQAEKHITTIDENTQDRLYTISWYVEPPKDELTYTVSLVGDGDRELASETALPREAGNGFNSLYINDKNYTHVRITSPEGYLQVPIISVES